MASVRSLEDHDDTRQAVRSIGARAMRRSRPLTATQERLFFGVLLATAALIQAGAIWISMFASS